MLNQLQRGDEPALPPCRRSGFLRRPQVGRVIAGELEPQGQAQQGGRLGRGGVDADWQQGHLIDNLSGRSDLDRAASP
jgi:hypothetical protein